MRKQTRLPFRSRVFVGMIGLLSLSGCDAKIDQFFQPATDIAPIGNQFPTALDLDGLAISVNYVTTLTTCEVSLSPFTADADLTTSGSGPITLNVTFSDAPVPITGTYVVDTGAYTGETGDVDIGSNLFANEQWDVSFTKNGNSGTMSGHSVVDVVEIPGSFTCQRQFNISAALSF
ncbi:MAG: hypothetical protein E4H28_06485 [Gemmatimonadales bacterium]|nr:MAG: hypothetical protein E4H28_06485 [Gemmatimonadales bacterium]